MYKRLLSLILCICMLMTVILVPAGAKTPEDVTALTDACPCGCGSTLDSVTWRIWDPNQNGVPATGHYYLTGDYEQVGQLEIISNNKIVLDLQGHTLTTADYHRLFLIYGYVAVLDSVGGGRLSGKTTGKGYGGIVSVSTNETNGSVFELYSGTVTPDAANKGSRRGGLINVSGDATFRMHGGRLLNGSTVSTALPDTKEPGGCVAGANSVSTIEILGGEIIGGESATHGGNIYNIGTTVLKNCKIVGGIAARSGGNICQNGGSLTIENCTISDGISQNTEAGGGNICIMTSAAMTMKDSTVRNGYTTYNGGNIYIGTASATIENCKIESGVSEKLGNNLYGYTGASQLILRNCQIPGDVSYLGTSLKLEGLVKIGLLNNGLRLWHGENVATVDTTDLAEGSEIYVDAKGLFTEASASLSYFKGAIRTVLSESAEGLVATQAEDGQVGGYCPHCGEQVAWQAFSLESSHVQNCLLDSATDTDSACTGNHLENGHYYLTESLSGVKQQYVGIYLKDQGSLVSKDVVVDLAGCSIAATARAFYLRPGSTANNVERNRLTLLDSWGAGKITGSGTNNQGGGVIYNEGSILTVYGGNYVYSPVSGRNVAGGGVLFGSHTANIHGGTFDGSAFTYTDQSTTDKSYSYNGGTVNVGSGEKYFTMTAGCIKGGHAKEGGAVYFGHSNQINITGGQFLGGEADGSGGTIRLYGTESKTGGTLSISNAALRYGEATTTGGNLYTHYYTVSLDNCYMDGGVSSDYAGNMNIGTLANATISDSIFINGSAKRGGNLYVAATSAVLNMDNSLLINGSATTYSGNLHSGNGEITITGGQILFGTAGSYGGNINSGAGNYSATSTNFTRLCKDNDGNMPLIAGGQAGTKGGNVYLSGVLYLDAAQLQGGNAATSGQDIYMTKQSNQLKLSVGEDVTGTFTMYIDADNLGSNIYGEEILHTECTALNATITLEGDYQDALLCAKDGKLYVGAYAVVDGSGNMTWYADAASALAACPEGSFVRTYLDSDIALTKDAVLDICGNKVNISGDYTVSLMDTKGGGEATLAEETDTLAEFVAPDGVRYLTKVTDGITTSHPLDMKISGVSLRAAATGIYYTGSWTADDVSAQFVDSYGVVISTAVKPDATFMNQGSPCMWTVQTGTLDNNTQQCSVLVSDIMKTAEQDANRTAEINKENGETTINAAAYVKLKDGKLLLSECVSYSLYDVMAKIDSLTTSDPIHYRKYTNPMRSFYDRWDEFGMADWRFNKIQPPVDDGVLDILMIGGSFSYYYVEELYGMAAAAGIPMRVCNLYYSGAGPKQHWTWWKNGESPCQFYNTDGNGRVETDNVGLEWALAQDDWDVLSLQYPSGTVRTATAQEGFDANKQYTDDLVAYLKEQFPDATLYIQQVWAYQIGYDRDSFSVPDRDTQLGLYQRHQELANIACETYGLPKVPSGEAWELIRQGGYDNLCARLGKGTNHEGDYYHEGDIGGGQYLNACVWFETVTGQSCIGNTYVPSYVYSGTTYNINSDITLDALQNAAHQAVADMNAQ